MIVGGGITGLAVAHALDKGTCSVTLVEAANHLGGNLVTVNYNGYIIDGGPDSWVAAKPHATALAKSVGLGDELIGTRPDTRRVHIVWNRRLHVMPEGAILGVPTEWSPFAKTDLLGWDAKLRAGLDLIVPKREWHGDEDESIAAFVSRRLGSDVTERLAGPLLGGIFAGDAEALSARACIPQLVEAEQKYGSLIVAMRALRRRRLASGTGGEAASAFTSLKRGVGDLVLNVAHRLKNVEVRTGVPTTSIDRLPAGDTRGRWVVQTKKGSLFADHVVLAVSAAVASRLLLDLDPRVSEALGAFDSASTATVFMAYRKFDVRHPLDSTGFLVPRRENRPIIACTYVSSKWEHRAPSGQILLRVFFGGAGHEAILARDDASLVRIAREQLHDLIGIERPPAFTKIFRFDHASPQPRVGHLARMGKVLARIAAHEGLHAGGNGWGGTGIPDSIKQGQEIAERILR